MRFPFRSKPALQCLRGHVSSFPPAGLDFFLPENSALQYISLPIFIEKSAALCVSGKARQKPPGPLSCRNTFNRIFEGLSSAKSPSLPKKALFCIFPMRLGLGAFVILYYITIPPAVQYCASTPFVVGDAHFRRFENPKCRIAITAF